MANTSFNLGLVAWLAGGLAYLFLKPSYVIAIYFVALLPILLIALWAGLILPFALALFGMVASVITMLVYGYYDLEIWILSLFLLGAGINAAVVGLLYRDLVQVNVRSCVKKVLSRLEEHVVV